MVWECPPTQIQNNSLNDRIVCTNAAAANNHVIGDDKKNDKSIRKGIACCH